jgi:tetratricopeptide (TPR) repeat protein
MTFKAAKCPNCAGDIQVPEDRDSAKCMYCGSDIIVREAIRLAGGINIENLLAFAKHSEELGDFSKALEYYDKILESDVKNVPAWIGKGLVSLNHPGQLKTCIENAINYSNDKEDLKINIINMLFARIKKYPTEWSKILALQILKLDKDNFEAQFFLNMSNGLLDIGELKAALNFTKNSPSHRQKVLDYVKSHNQDFARYINNAIQQAGQEGYNNIYTEIEEVLDMLPKEYSYGIKKEFINITTGLNQYGPLLEIRNKYIKQIQNVERDYRPVMSKIEQDIFIEKNKSNALMVACISGLTTCVILFLIGNPVGKFLWGTGSIGVLTKMDSWLKGVHPFWALIYFFPALICAILLWIISFGFPVVAGLTIAEICYKGLKRNTIQ